MLAFDVAKPGDSAVAPPGKKLHPAIDCVEFDCLTESGVFPVAYVK
jgi:hypothetical protein